MHLEVVPLLTVMRDLYSVPRGPARFEAYLRAVTRGADDVDLLPLVTMNPMAREHVNATVDELISWNAEDAVRRACEEAAARLRDVGGTFKVGLAVLDDVMGGWTQRELMEASSLLRRDVANRDGWDGARWLAWRSWVTVGLWASDAHDEATVRRETLASVYRTAHVETVGLPETLEDMLRQEGRVMRFAGVRDGGLDEDDLAYTREVLAPHRSSKHFPTVFACLFGDEAAKRVGFPPLGLSDRAGFALALEEARPEVPERALRSSGVT